MCITLIKLSINSSGEVQPKWTMSGQFKYIPNIVMDLDTISNKYFLIIIFMN